MVLMSRKEAWIEARARFPGNWQKQQDFMKSWWGLARRRHCREKIAGSFGRGRRSKRVNKQKPAPDNIREKASPHTLWQRLVFRLRLFWLALKMKNYIKTEKTG